MITVEEKENLIKNISNDVPFILWNFKRENYLIKRYEHYLQIYKNKLIKTKKEIKIKDIKFNIEGCENDIKKHTERIKVIENYYNEYIIENLEKIDNNDFKIFILNFIVFEPNKKIKLTASELFHKFNHLYQDVLNYKEFNSLMKKLKLKWDCPNVLTFYGLNFNI